MMSVTDTHIQVENSSDNAGEPKRTPYLFFRKLFYFLLIPAVIYEVWIIVTPLNLYTFRAWETLKPHLLVFYGPFYPNQHVTITEAGDLGVRTEYSLPRSVTFITDEYGYRFDSNAAPTNNYDIVIVGDSLTTGSNLTQTDAIAPVLSVELQRTVYPLAPASIGTLLSDERFGTTLPPVVILQVIERDIVPGLCPANLTLNPRSRYFIDTIPALAQARVIVDRSIRELNYLKNYLASRSRARTVIANNEGMVFYEPSLTSRAVETIPDVVAALSRCQQWFAEQGVEFIFLPVPDREDVYFDSIPDSHRPTGITYTQRSQFLRQLIHELQANNIPVVDTLSAYEAARDSGMNPYHLDDTHWNASGVRLVADILIELLTANTSD